MTEGRIGRLPVWVNLLGLGSGGCASAPQSSGRYQILQSPDGCYVLDNKTDELGLYNGEGERWMVKLNHPAGQSYERFFTSLPPQDAMALALKAVHDAFGLDAPPTFRGGTSGYAWATVESSGPHNLMSITSEEYSTGATAVTLQSDMPPAQIAALTKVIRGALDGRDAP